MRNKQFEDRLTGLFELMLEDLESVDKSEAVMFAVQRQVSRMRKRAAYTDPTLAPKCLATFKDMNQSLKEVNIKLDDDIVSNARMFITTIFERYNTTLSDLNIQCSFDRHHLLDLWKFGPGSSNGVKGTHTADKILQKMTCTESCEPLVVWLRRSNPYFSTFDSVNGDNGTTRYSGSKITTVPKNEDTVRVIAIEPSGNMALQLAGGRYIEAVLRSIGLDIQKQQPKNKALALRGSISNSLATIDLKSASDMFTPRLIELLMPKPWYEFLMKVRSPEATIGGEQVTLNMISTMGNGFTFPLMTLILASFIYALRCRHGGPNLYIDWTSTAVYGDDVIIHSHEFAEYAGILQDAGLIVNVDKSYSDGPFRESCGGDYYNGYDVTPVYVESLTQDSELYVAINKILEWGARHKIVLHRSLLFLRSLLKGLFLVPEWSNPDQGILTTLVRPRYKFLQPEVHKVKLECLHFAVPLFIGGYVEELSPPKKGRNEDDGPNLCYTPRQNKTRMLVRRGRLPNGFLSGRFPESREADQSTNIDVVVQILFL